MSAESTQYKGMEGAVLAKQWIEGTTHFEITFNAYEQAAMTTLMRLDGGKKCYDLFGHRFEPRQPLYVEVKNYDTVGGQPEEYTQYLVNAYSTTAYVLDQQGNDPEFQYMWVTWHPFSQTKWPKLTHPDELRNALNCNPDALNGKPVDEELLRTVASRLWMIVLSRRQEELLLTRTELYRVQEALRRKGT